MSYINGCVVIHTIVQRSYVEGLWGHRYCGCCVRYSGSNDMNTVPVTSLIMWCDVINCGCEILCIIYNVTSTLSVHTNVVTILHPLHSWHHTPYMISHTWQHKSYICHLTLYIWHYIHCICVIKPSVSIVLHPLAVWHYTLYVWHHIQYAWHPVNTLWHHTRIVMTSHPVYLWHHIQYIW